MIALVLGVALGAEPAAAPADGPTGDMYVASTPAGAAVFLDGVNAGVVTPTMLHVAVGDHGVDVRTACAHVVLTASVKEKAVTRLDLTLPADAPGTLVISSTPPGAFITLDGQDVGAAPYTGPAACGPHEVSSVLAGHLPHAERVSVMAGETTKFELVLVPQKWGGLSVVPTPLDAVVSIDGAAQAAGPVTLDHLLATSHDVSVTLAGYEPYIAPVVVPPNDVVRLDVSLDPVGPPRRHIPFVRLGINTAVTGVGIGFTYMAIFGYSQTKLAYADYLTIPDDDAAEAHYDAEVWPRRKAIYINGTVGGVILAAGAVLFVTTPFSGKASDLHVGISPNGASISGRW